MNNLESFSLTCNLPIGKAFIQSEFFPVQFDQSRAILILNTFEDPNKDSRVYDYFQDLIDFGSPILSSYGYFFYQPLSGKETPLKTFRSNEILSVNQISYLIENAPLVITNDSIYSHIANSFGVKCISLYGPSDPKNRSPKFHVDSFVAIRESNSKPNYSSKENNKSINEIKTETIIKEISKQLNLDIKLNFKTLYRGKYSHLLFLEAIPDCVLNPNNFQDKIITFRNDYLENQSLIFENLKYRKCNIITKTELDLNALFAFRQNILCLNFEVDSNTSIDYCKNLIKTGVKLLLFTRLKGDELSKVRMKFFDLGIIEEYISPKVPKLDISKKLVFSTRRFLLSDGKIYPSFDAYLKQERIESFSGHAIPYNGQDLDEIAEFISIFELDSSE